MKKIFGPGDMKQLLFTVATADLARFPSGVIHEVYSTFALARDAEWTTRQFVLEMRDDDEEGIGTLVHVVHKSPALLHEQVVIRAIITQMHGHEIICDFSARVGHRLIATGQTGQKIFKRSRLDHLFSTLARNQK